MFIIRVAFDIFLYPAGPRFWGRSFKDLDEIRSLVRGTSRCASQL